MAYVQFAQRNQTISINGCRIEYSDWKRPANAHEMSKMNNTQEYKTIIDLLNYKA